MNISSLVLQAPGVRAMQNGQPWSIPGNQHRTFPLAPPSPHLPNIQNLFHSTEVQNVSQLSPKSMSTNSPRVTGRRRLIEHMRDHGSQGSSQETHIKERLLPPLIVPQEAQKAFGGFFDPDNWVFQIVWEEFRHMNIPELLHAFYYRSDRGKYGENHTSTRGTVTFDQGAGGRHRRSTGNEKHRRKEQGRRVRHRGLQAESDELISTFTLEMAQKIFPKVKAGIEKMHGSRKSPRDTSLDDELDQHDGKLRAANGAGKKLGKDDQLTAALVHQHLTNILIFRLLEDIEVLENESALLKSEGLKQEDASSLDGDNKSSYWRQRFENSEAERINLEKEVLRFQLQWQEEASRTRNFPQPTLPLLVGITTKKRCFDTREERNVNTSRIHDARRDHQVKRRHLDASLELPPIALHCTGLPSPAPSFNGSPVSSTGTSFSTASRMNVQAASRV